METSSVVVARTPTGRKLQLAALLRHLRESSHLTQAEAGRAVWPHASAASVQNKIARLESADTGITTTDLTGLLQVYGAAGDSHAELAIALNTGLSQRGRWSGDRAAYPEAYRRYVDLEEDAELIRFVSNERVPDLLQCESYLRIEFADVPGYADSTRARQEEVLFGPRSARCYVVLSESAVRHVQGDDRVMAEQIRWLLKLSELPNVTLQMVPFRPAGGTKVIAHKGILERFALLRLASPGVLGELPRYLDYAFTRTGDELNWREDVRHFEDLWNRATTAALPPRESRAFLDLVATDFG